jgi:carboxypeptidase family protein/TonB-dependent receptor-like protein
MKTMRSLLRRGALVVGTVVALLPGRALPLHAQTPGASLSGSVQDEAGAVMPGVTLTLRSPATGTARTALTDAKGRYLFLNVDPAEYDLRAEHAGFKSVTRNGIVLSVGGAPVVDLVMAVGPVSEEVTVVREEPILEATRAELSRVVSAREIESLPNMGRNFVDFVKMSAGVAAGRENVGGGPFKEADTSVGAAAAPRLSFGGQSELYTMIQVDGADNVQTFTGLPRATPSQEAAQEFRVVTSTYLAEYGRSLAGFVNIVTKSGTNELRGSAYYFGMNDGLNARSALSRAGTNVLRQHQYGVTLGGPFVKDRTFFFGNYEGQRRRESNRFSKVVTDNLAALNAVRSQFGLRPETDDQQRTSDYAQFLLKLDHRLSARHRLFARYNLLDSEALNFPGGGGRASPASSAARNNQTHDQSLVGGVVSVFSSRLVNEARLQWARRTYDYRPLVNEPSLEITNLIIMGKSSSDMDGYREGRLQLTDSLSWVRGSHELKAGVDASAISDHGQWNVFFPARIVFPSLTAFFNVAPTLFAWPTLAGATVHPGFSLSWSDALPPEWQGGTEFDVDHRSYGAFVQDQWKASAKLSLTYGLRYDVESYSSRYLSKTDLDNVQPRLGFAYTYRPRGVVRGGYGRFSDRIANSVGQVFGGPEFNGRGHLPNAAVLYPDVARLAGRLTQNSIAGAGARPAALTLLTTGKLPASVQSGLDTSLSSRLRSPYSHQASLQISQETAGGVVASASYLFLGARDLIGRSVNLNAVQTGVLPSGKPILAGRRFPELGDFIITHNSVHSTYHGGTLQLQKRFAAGVGFHLSYTLSRTRSNGDSVANVADLPEGLDPGLEESLSRQHVAHRFTLSLLAQMPSGVPVLRGLKLSSLVTLESGRYFTVYAGRDANGDGNPTSDRPGLLGRNTLQGPGYATVDLRLAREIALSGRLKGELAIDVYNLLNRTNVRDLNTNYGGIDLNLPPDPLLGFGTARDVFNPRQLQLGLKLRF